jgi:hypothetical protein
LPRMRLCKARPREPARQRGREDTLDASEVKNARGR